MILNIITITLKVLSAFTMFYFARPKLLAMPVSVKSFTQFGEMLPVNGRMFMYFTGGLELLTALVLFASIFMNNAKWGIGMSLSGYLLLLGTMIGALITEYAIRPEPVPFLVSIAIIMIFIALPQLFLITKFNG